MDAALSASRAECLTLPDAAASVACSAQVLNITDPPSIYDWNAFSFLWTPVTCLLANVTYAHRVDQPDSLNFCTVPQEGIDSFLFAGVALLVAACALGKLAVLWVLMAGGALGTATYWANLRELGNGVALWLGISPPDLFFYAFIPPLALDSALRLDVFLFRKTWPHMLLTAFVMVIASAFLLTPIILFALGFDARGFTWAHVALFSAMVASTDALSVTAILKKTGGPELLVTLLEGESLLNDASAITLFEVFKSILESNADPSQPFPSVWSSLPDIMLATLRLAGVGAGVGLAMSIALGYLLRWLRWHGAGPNSESIAALATSFLAFYVANSPAGGSGVIAVVVFGLWGNFTRKWGMLAASEESGAFDAFWDACTLGANGLVFFWSGCACANFLIRSAGTLAGSAWSWGAIPIIYVALVGLRTASFALFNCTAFRWLKQTLTWPEVAFAGWAGLRGSVSLIMIADYMTHSTLLLTSGNPQNSRQEFVNSEITLWTASFVLLTLLINAPTLAPLVRLLRLDHAARRRRGARARAKRSLARFTAAALEGLQQQEKELLAGANWEAVAHFTDLSASLKDWDLPLPQKRAEGGGDGGDGAIGSSLGAAEAAAAAGDAAGEGSDSAGSICAEVTAGLPFLEPQLLGRTSSQVVAQQAQRSTRQQAQHAPEQGEGGSGRGGDVEQGMAASGGRAAGRPAPLLPAGSRPGDAAEEAFYSTVPASAGAALQRQLQQVLRPGRDQQVQQQQQQQTALPSQQQQPAPQQQQPAEQQQQQPAEADEGATGTLSPAARRQLAQQVALQLAQLQQRDRAVAPAGPQPCSGPPSPRASLGSGASLALPHGFTLSGAAGVSMAAELRRQLAQPGRQPGARPGAAPPAFAYGGVPPPPYQQPRDLLGRRLARAASSSGPQHWPGAGAGLRLPPALPRSTTWASREGSQGPSSPAGSTASSQAKSFAPPAVAPLTAELQLRRAQTFNMPPPAAQQSGLGLGLPVVGADATPNGFGAPPAAAAGPHSCSAAARPAWRVYADGRGADAPLWPGGDAAAEGAPAGEACLPDSRGAPDAAELRRGLLAGLRRTCHARRMQGLLSAEGLRTLEYCFARAVEQADLPLHVWSGLLVQEVQGGLGIRLVARTQLALTRGFAALPALARPLVSWSFRKLSGLLRRVLGCRMLASCEAAVEYWLALERAAQLPLAAAGAQQAEQLRQEVEAEAEAVQRFIAEREVEAPETFQAIQSYRAAMAVLRRQAAFAQELFLGGAVEEGERDEVLEELGRLMRRLEIKGPVWKPPRPGAVLRSLPFLRCLPRPQLERLLSQGSMREYKQGEEFWRADTAGSGGSARPGLFVTLAGVVRRCHQAPDGAVKEHFQSTGGVVGALLVAAGTHLPGSEWAVAEGNSLGRGPLLFHLPQAALDPVLEEAHDGKPAAARCRLELSRLAAGAVLERAESDVAAAVERHIERQAVSGALLRPSPLKRASLGGPQDAARAAGSLGAGSELALVMQLIAAQEVEEQDIGAQPSAAAAAAAGLEDVAALSSRRPPPSAVRAWAAEVVALMRQGLHAAVLLDLPPGAAFRQARHAVLLAGRLAGGAASPPEGEDAAAAAPAVLPCWGDVRLSWSVGDEEWWLRAGGEGALLLVWLRNAGEVPPEVEEATQAAAARQQQHRQQQQQAGGNAGEAQLTHEEALLVLKLAVPQHAAGPGGGGGAAPAALSARQIFEREATASPIITFVPELDTMMGGGVETGAITEFCGVPGVGKTQLGMQLALDVQIPAAFGGLAGEAVYIDTEGSFMLERCCQMADALSRHLARAAAAKGDAAKAAAAAAVGRDALLAGIHYFRIRDHVEQLAAVELMPGFLEAHPAVKLVVIDSVTFHFRQDFADMAARTRQLAAMAQHLMALAGERDVAVVLMNQVTTKLGGDRGEGSSAAEVAARLVPALGDSWAHAATSRVILHWHEGRRRAFLYKSPTQPACGAEYAITADGSQRWEAEAAPKKLDVFGVGRPDATPQRSLLWTGLKPGADARVASVPGVDAVVCSGLGPNDVQIVKDCRRVGKAVFVESLEHFQPGDLAELAAAGSDTPFMTGLYLRFDSVLQEATDMGIASVVGRPLLYQACASAPAPSLTGRVRHPTFGHHRYAAVAPSLFELGMEQVDALRLILSTEPTEVYAAGTARPGAAGGQAGWGAYQAVSLTIKTASGALAVVTLDAHGSASPRQRILVLGDANRVSFAGEVAAADLQAAGINHFLDAATEGVPPRVSADDCLRAAAVMAAAAASLRSGAPEPVSLDFASAARRAAEEGQALAGEVGATPAGATAAVASAAASAGASLVAGAQRIVMGAAEEAAGVASGSWTPAGRAASEAEEGVSTLTHQGTPPPKSVSTPESPPLITTHPGSP
ncbi:Sodium hydrogen exchanger 7 [Micractinium conductrix]|uniref:DNA repair protein RAD51 homolog 3 n=1 Tax=Micractinium conductrix TaxID=554055 RepID=A0A2P6VM80_9CHLO|nr:Sodium hydrogen exchanger 7 [Micractinium conductrix]|eukprot:PSC75198.1 Sodium hydrogen exchanger 7 [Micractinium conductrix]